MLVGSGHLSTVVRTGELYPQDGHSHRKPEVLLANQMHAVEVPHAGSWVVGVTENDKYPYKQRIGRLDLRWKTDTHM